MAKKVTIPKELTERQKKFCEEYLIDLNGTQAVIRAGYSENGAAVHAVRLLSNAKIAAYVKEIRENQKEKTDISAEFVLAGLKEVVQRSLTRKKVMKWDYEEKALVHAKNEETGEGIYEYDSNGANKALELLGKHLGLFEKDNKQQQLLVAISGMTVK